MDHMDSRGIDSDADLEYGEIRRGDFQNKGWRFNVRNSTKMVDGEWSVVLGPNGSVKGDDQLTASNNSLKSSENVEIYVDDVGKEAASPLKKKLVEEKQKSSSMKPPKPPRPPGSPSYDEADLQLYREISELARLKYVRVQRMKALKKKRADKASSPVASFFAMVITIIFCCVIIFQGILGSHI